MKMYSHVDRERGSVLLTALFIAIIIAVALTAFLQVSSQSMRFSDRSHLTNRALALAEAGIEDGLSALRRGAWAGEGWSVSGNDMVKTITETPTDGITDEIKIRVVDYLGAGISSPRVFARGRCLPGGGGAAIESHLRVDTGREPLFGGALVAMRKMKLKDHAFIDSYDSTLGPYGGANTGYDAVVAVLDPAKSKDFVIDKTEVRGWVKSGGIMPKLANNATIVGPNSNGEGYGKGKWDPDRVSTTYAEEFPVFSAPTTYDFYEAEIKNAKSLGNAASGPISYMTGSFVIDEKKTTTITGPVRLIVTGDVTIKGNLVVSAQGSLEIFVQRHFKLDGEGSMTIADNDPTKLIMFGTDRPADKKVKSTFDFKGKAEDYYGALYAPSSRVKIEKDGDFFGSIVANNIEIKKAGSFHQDVSLEEFTGNIDDWLKDGGRPERYLIAGWNTQLTAGEKALLNF